MAHAPPKRFYHWQYFTREGGLLYMSNDTSKVVVATIDSGFTRGEGLAVSRLVEVFVTTYRKVNKTIEEMI